MVKEIFCWNCKQALNRDTPQAQKRGMSPQLMKHIGNDTQYEYYECPACGVEKAEPREKDK
jgi:DNA-directed RNA polymerase subunit RPC12/RpoP